MLKRYFFLFLLLPSLYIRAQHIDMLTENHDCSLRGLSAVNDQVIWVTGSNSTVGLSTDAGVSWRWMTVGHFEKTDFRDVEAFSDKEAIIMGVTEPAVILKTTDGGQSWRTVFRDSTKGMFLDAMDFHGSMGMVVGDPINQRIFLIKTIDQGEHWQPVDAGPAQTPLASEAFFASSGSNISFLPNSDRFVFVSGGAASALYIDSLQRIPLAVKQGGESTGANGIAFSMSDTGIGIIVGGDFKRDNVTDSNCVVIHLPGFTQTKPLIPPHGYRSAVVSAGAKQWVTCGTSGVDWSADNGNTWKTISTRGFHVCGRSKSGNHVFLAGPKGSVAILVPEPVK